MKVHTGLSTRFATAQNAHQVGLLVTVEGERPPERPPINVSLVLDRSGSMAGEPLHAAKEAALRFLGFLGQDDRVSVVSFDDAVRTEFGPGAGNDADAVEAVRSIRAGGSTNLSGGWLQGRTHVADRLVTGTNRVVLLTDAWPTRAPPTSHNSSSSTAGRPTPGHGQAGDRHQIRCVVIDGQ